MAARRLANLGVHRKHIFFRVAVESLKVEAPNGVVIGSSIPVRRSKCGALFLFVIWADFTPFALQTMSPISMSLNCVVVMAGFTAPEILQVVGRTHSTHPHVKFEPFEHDKTFHF